MGVQILPWEGAVLRGRVTYLHISAFQCISHCYPATAGDCARGGRMHSLQRGVTGK